MHWHKGEDVQWLTSGPCETGVEKECYRDVLERVLKKGTLQPWLPNLSIVIYSTSRVSLVVLFTVE